MIELDAIDKGIQLAAGSYRSIATVFDDVFSRVEKIKNKNLSVNNLLRAYYFEVVNNIEFLSVVNTRHLQSQKPNSPSLRFIAARIETQIGATILFDDKVDEKSELFKLLKNKGQLHNSSKTLVRVVKGKEEISRQKSFYENILQAISFTVVKTEFLKRLADFDDSDLEVLKDIKLEIRIDNIFERFNMIKIKLEELDAIASVAR